MPKIKKEEYTLISPGMRVRIASRLCGAELYDAEDPSSLRMWCGKEVTVKNVVPFSDGAHKVFVEELSPQSLYFYMEEIECIVTDEEISESDESIAILLGV